MSGGGHRPRQTPSPKCKVITGYVYTPVRYLDRGFTAVEQREYVDGLNVKLLVSENQYVTMLLAWDSVRGTTWWSKESKVSSSACTQQAIGGFVRTARAELARKKAQP